MLTLETVVRKCSEKAFNFIKKETLAQVFSCECCEISNNTFFTEHVRATASTHFSQSKSILGRAKSSHQRYFKKRFSQMYRKIHRWFSVNFAILLRTLSLQNTSGRLLLVGEWRQWTVRPWFKFEFGKTVYNYSYLSWLAPLYNPTLFTYILHQACLA